VAAESRVFLRYHSMASASAFAAKAPSPAVLPQRAIGSGSVQRRRHFPEFRGRRTLPDRTNCKLRIVVTLLRADRATRPFFLAFLRLDCLELRGNGRVARHEVSAEVFVPSHGPSAPTMSMAYLVGIFQQPCPSKTWTVPFHHWDVVPISCRRAWSRRSCRRDRVMRS
jgi:hypothetical protein